MVRRLFKNLLHKDSSYDIYFAKRGKEDRTAALYAALESARERLFETWGIRGTAPIHVYPRVYYTQKKPLTVAALDDLPGI